MKVALSSRLSDEYLKQADEIRIKFPDRDIIYDFIEKYPDKILILEFFINQITSEDDLLEIKNFGKLSKNILFRTDSLVVGKALDEEGFNWFYGTIVKNWDDLLLLSRTNTRYVLIGGDLFFDMPKVKEFDIPVRCIPNVSSQSWLQENVELDFDINIVGDWILPDALHQYDDYIETIEFEDCNIIKEQALFRIYWLQQGWKTNLNKLITNLKADADTPFINPTWFTGTRLSCRRTCIANNNYGCQACYRQFSLANYEKLKEYKETVLDKKDTGTTVDIEQYENNKENT